MNDNNVSYNVVLTNAGANKIKVIKVVRDTTGLGLKEASDFVENPGMSIKQCSTIDEAIKIKEKFKNIGAHIIIERIDESGAETLSDTELDTLLTEDKLITNEIIGHDFYDELKEAKIIDKTREEEAFVRKENIKRIIKYSCIALLCFMVGMFIYKNSETIINVVKTVLGVGLVLFIGVALLMGSNK